MLERVVPEFLVLVWSEDFGFAHKLLQFRKINIAIPVFNNFEPGSSHGGHRPQKLFDRGSLGLLSIPPWNCLPIHVPFGLCLPILCILRLDQGTGGYVQVFEIFVEELLLGSGSVLVQSEPAACLLCRWNHSISVSCPIFASICWEAPAFSVLAACAPGNMWNLNFELFFYFFFGVFITILYLFWWIIGWQFLGTWNFLKRYLLELISLFEFWII